MSGTGKMVGKPPVKNEPNTKRDSVPSGTKQSPKTDRSDKQQSSSKAQPNHGGGRGSWQKPQDKHEDSDNVGDKRKDDAKKFTGRCRLFVGNLSQETTETEFRKLFEPYGEISEVYLNTAKGFGFIRLDYRHNADAAKASLDGMQIGNSNRVLRVRFATHGAALKVKNLHPCVSNELLESAFSQFGDVERAIVIVDDRGKSMGEGIIEFSRKPGAAQALKRINDGVFILTSSPRPVTVEPLEQKDDEDGLSEKFIMKNDEYKKEREKEPRLAPHGSFEFEFGQRWKRLSQIEAQQLEQVKTHMEQERMKLEDDMENAMFEHQADLIRQDLMRQQEELRRMEEARQKDRMRKRQDIEMRQGGMPDQFLGRMNEEKRRAEMMRAQSQAVPDEQMRRRMQEHAAGFGGQGRPEEMFRQGAGGGGAGGGMHDGRPKRSNAPMQPPPVPPAGLGRGNAPNQMAGAGEESQGENSGNFSQGSPSMPGAAAAQAQMQRQSRFDQPPAGKFGGPGGAGQGNFPPRGMGGGRGGQGQAPGGGPGQPRGGGNMFPEQGQGERRREGGQREDFGDMKRMRRY